MEVMQAIKLRRSIRRYRPEPVPPEHIDVLLESARLAPSASNLQTWKFKVVTDADLRKSLREAAFSQKFVERAPLVIVGCIDFAAYQDRAKRTLELIRTGAVKPNLGMILRYARGSGTGLESEERQIINGVVNVTIAMEHMVLAAVELGLGTCWVRAFEPEKVMKLLSLPTECYPLALLTVGYPREDPEPRPRKQLKEILL